MSIYPMHKETKTWCPIIFCRSWWWLEWLEQVEPLYKECQWHTNEDQTMCESKASIWWKTVHWCQCNSYEGMHKHIQMPSRYLTNFNEQFCLLSFPLPELSRDQYRSQLTYMDWNFWPHSCLLACTQSVIGAHIGVLMQHATRARHTKEIKGNN